MDTLHGVLGRANDFLNTSLIKTADIELTVGALVGALIVLLLAVVVSWLVRYALKRYGDRYATNQSALYTLARVLHYALLIAGVLIALAVAGIPFSKFALFAGALGVGLGFGLQAIFANFISGLIILFDRSLKVGDFVELGNGVHGHVRDIHIRATRVTTNDNIDILVPNSEFVTHNVVNWTWRDVSRRSHVPFRVAYGTDKELVKKAALEAASSVPFTLTQEGPRAPQVWLTSFGESALNFSLVVWLNGAAARRSRGITAAYNWALHNALEKYGIAIPFPQSDLHVRSWFGLERDEARDAVREDRHLARGKLPQVERAALADNDAARSVASHIEQDRGLRGDETADDELSDRDPASRARGKPGAEN